METLSLVIPQYVQDKSESNRCHYLIFLIIGYNQTPSVH